MRIRYNKKVSKVLKYTLFVVTVVCSTFYQKTNSKFYSSSELNGNNIIYNTGYYKLYDETDGSMKVNSYNRNNNTAIVSFNFDAHNVGQDITKNEFKVSSNNCRVIKVNTTAGDSHTYTNSNVPVNIPVLLECDGNFTNTKEVEAFGHKVTLSGNAEIKADAIIEEKVNDEESFKFREYKERTLYTAVYVPFDDYIELDTSNSEAFYYGYVEWILRYVYTNINEQENIDLIINYLNNFINKEDKENSVINMQSGEILGIDITPLANGKKKFSISKNFVGYIKTYNDYNIEGKDPNILKMHFSDISATSVNKAFNEYIDAYFDEADEETKEAIKAYVQGAKNGSYTGAYAVIRGYPIYGLTPVGTSLSLNKALILKAIDTSNDISIDSSTSTKAQQDFNNLIPKAPILTDINDIERYKNQILLSRIYNDATAKTQFAHYLIKDFIKDSKIYDYKADEYFIYYLKNDGVKDRYLLIKVNHEENAAKMLLRDLDDEIELSKTGQGIFTNLTGKRIHINIVTQDQNLDSTSADYIKTKAVIDKIKGALKIPIEETEAIDFFNVYSSRFTETFYYYNYNYTVPETIASADLNPELAEINGIDAEQVVINEVPDMEDEFEIDSEEDEVMAEPDSENEFEAEPESVENFNTNGDLNPNGDNIDIATKNVDLYNKIKQIEDIASSSADVASIDEESSKIEEVTTSDESVTLESSGEMHNEENNPELTGNENDTVEMTENIDIENVIILSGNCNVIQE